MNIHQTLAAIILFLLLAHVCPTASAQATGSDDWEFALAPYVWGAGLDGDVTLKGITASTDLSFSDLLDALDFGAQVHFEARRDNWSFFFDATFMSFSEDAGVPLISVDVGTDLSLVEGFLAYRFGRPELSFEVLGGFRYWDIEGDIDFSPGPSVEASKDWVDPIIGGIFSVDLSDHWYFRLRGDLGGFDLSSSSDFTWNITTVFVRDWERLSLVIGYRHLVVDFDEGSGFDEFGFDVDMSGPLLGLGFRW